MRDNNEHQRQLAATVEAAAELNARRDAQASRTPEPPRPGDVFLSRLTADFPVEWLMIEEDEDGGARVVPIDEHPYAGSRDLELSPEILGGAGVVRCDLDVRLDASVLEPELRTAALTGLELGRVRRKRRAIASDTLEPSLLEEVVDGDPEYHRWRTGTLRPALDALTGRIAETVEHGPATPRRRCRHLIAVAAFLALALPLGWQAYLLSRQLDQEQGRVAELEQERQALEEQLAAAEADRQSSAGEAGRLEAALSDAVSASERALAEQRERFVARLRRAFEVSAAVNVPAFVLRPSGTRSVTREPMSIDPGDAARFTLSLLVADPEPYPRYRLRMVEQAGGAEVWRTDDLVKLDGRWLRLDLPAELIEAGEYQLLIYGLGPAGPRPLEERYTVKLER